MTDYLEIDRLAKDFAARDGQPGLAYGVVAGGRLVHSGGLGERWLGGPAPDAGTVFRIASMTKSFTASTILLLRDAGALRLDDPAEDYVPELRGLALPSADSPRPTLRHLLTMTGGFPTDDPWGDRQQGLAAADFAALLRGGMRLAWAPGTRFEYSNTGYAILGKVVEAVTGEPYSEAVRARILRAARPDQDRLRGRRVRPGRPGPRLPPGRRRLERAGPGRQRGLRPDGRGLQHRRRPGPVGERLRRRVPAARRRGRPGAPAGPGLAAGDAAGPGRHCHPPRRLVPRRVHVQLRDGPVR